MASKSKIVMKRALRGIYAGRHIRFGNKVSEDGGNKTRRCWRPNVQKKRLYSVALDRYVRIRVTTHAIRCIDKVGGLDEYLLRIPDNKLENERFVWWKKFIRQRYNAPELEERIMTVMTKNFLERCENSGAALALEEGGTKEDSSALAGSREEAALALGRGGSRYKPKETSPGIAALNENILRLQIGQKEGSIQGSSSVASPRVSKNKQSIVSNRRLPKINQGGQGVESADGQGSGEGGKGVGIISSGVPNLDLVTGAVNSPGVSDAAKNSRDD
eukprot:c19649_g1_i1 orf=261-1082(+)